jgi:hypothetical protein
LNYHDLNIYESVLAWPGLAVDLRMCYFWWRLFPTFHTSLAVFVHEWLSGHFSQQPQHKCNLECSSIVLAKCCIRGAALRLPHESPWTVLTWCLERHWQVLRASSTFTRVSYLPLWVSPSLLTFCPSHFSSTYTSKPLPHKMQAPPPYKGARTGSIWCHDLHRRNRWPVITIPRS